jgi:hypothetical protein
MNFFDMKLQFDRIQRTLQDAVFAEYRDDFLNQAYEKIAEMFVIPALIRTTTFDSVANQADYCMPYDYNGAEMFLYFKDSSSVTAKRLDPIPEDVLAMMYEYRSSNKGPVWYYDLRGAVGSDYAVRAACGLTNNSATVTCATAAALDVNHWVRFDTFTDTVTPNPDGTTTKNPGDYGYLITAVTVGVSYTLDRVYRGPSTPAGGTTGRLRPAEQMQFITYGIPTVATTNAFTLRYPARPRRLYNNDDVPEMSNLGLAIVYMAVSMGYDYLHLNDQAKVWFGRAASSIGNLQRRREYSKTLVTDLTIGSVSGRKTGARSVDLSRKYFLR